MKNVTISLDDETHRRARVRAAQLGKSLSGLVRDLLAEDSAEPADQGVAVTTLNEITTLRSKVPSGFRASERLSRDEAHRRG